MKNMLIGKSCFSFIHSDLILIFLMFKSYFFLGVLESRFFIWPTFWKLWLIICQTGRWTNILINPGQLRHNWSLSGSSGQILVQYSHVQYWTPLISEKSHIFNQRINNKMPQNRHSQIPPKSCYQMHQTQFGEIFQTIVIKAKNVPPAWWVIAE